MSRHKFIIGLEHNSFQGDIDRSVVLETEDFNEAIAEWNKLENPTECGTDESDGVPYKYYEGEPVTIYETAEEGSDDIPTTFHPWLQYTFLIIDK